MNPYADLDRFEPRQDPRPDDTAWPELIWPVPADTELIGDSVWLTELDPAADAKALFVALDHDAVWAHVPGRPQSAAQFEESLRARQALPEWHIWTVRRGRAVVGMTSYLDVNPADARLEIGSTVYTPSVWSTTVNPEAKLLLLSYAFDELGAGRVQLKTDIRNHRSQQAIARLGATYEGVMRRHFRRSDGTVRDTVMFSVTTEEWPEVRQRLEIRLGQR